MDDDTVADDVCLVLVVHLAFGDETTGHGAHLADLEDLALLHLARDDLFLDLVEHTDHGTLDVVERIVDDGVGVDLHAFAVSQFARVGRRAHLEADDDGVGSRGEHDVVLGDLSHGLADDVDLHLLRRELEERVGQCLHRSVGVALDDDVELVELSASDAVGNVAQREALLRAETLLALQLLALVGNLAGLLLRLEHVERVARRGRAVESEDDTGIGGSGLLDTLVALIEEGFDLAP